MNMTVNAVVVNQNGWWSVLCKELDISGFGDSKEAAIEAFERSLHSTVAARLRSELTPPPADRDEKCSVSTSSRRGESSEPSKVVRIIPLLGRMPALAGAH
jgi:hypothetical protein